MIRSSYLHALTFLALSTAAHSAFLSALKSDETAQIAGGAETSATQLGNSFADMVEAIVPPETPETITQEDVTEQQPDVQPQTLTDQVQPPSIEPLETTTPTAPSTEQTPLTQPTLTSQLSAAPDDVPVLQFSETQSAVLLPVPSASQITTAQPAQTITAPPPPTIAAITPEPSPVLSDGTTEVRVSRRPKLRTPEIEALKRKIQKAPAPKRTPKPTKIAKKPQVGNAKRNTKAGVAEGRNDAGASNAAKRQAANTSSAGNAATSNYGGKIIQRIRRLRRPRSSSKGSALVSFTIAANGGLSSASIARSSGSAQLDKAALAIVRKASPFPQPPAGARRSYKITIEAR